MRRIVVWQLALLAFSLSAGAGEQGEEGEGGSLGAGFRYSTYGPKWNPGDAYWGGVGQRMAAYFSGAVPEAIWIVGRLEGEGVELSFPASTDHPLIRVTEGDGNEEALTLFDRIGLRIWLQIEPGNAPVEELIHLMLARYGHHPSVIGVGVDVEWYRSVDKPEGQAVTDAEAKSWLAAARSHDPSYRLFLKHWEIEKMPPTARDGLFFVDDSQIFPSLDAMVAEFEEWGRAFAPAPVGFQYGYPSDRPWWQQLDDPPAAIGRRILAAVPNTEGLYWVDFTVLETFKPEPTPVREPMIGVKIYEHEANFGELFEAWEALSVNTAFVSETLARNAAFRTLAKERGVAVFVIAPIFFDPDALAEDEDLFAITAEGERAVEDWVQLEPGHRRNGVGIVVHHLHEHAHLHQEQTLRSLLLQLQVPVSQLLRENHHSLLSKN